jgi:hypothetical protein
VPSEPQTPDRDLPVIHQAAGALRALTGQEIDKALEWLDDAAQNANVTPTHLARRLIRALERRHAALRD